MKNSNARRRTPLFEVRHSPVHGHGVFALRRIRKGTTVLEYLGDGVTHARRTRAMKTRIPATITPSCSPSMEDCHRRWRQRQRGSLLNHGCDPNCESTMLGTSAFSSRRFAPFSPAKNLLRLSDPARRDDAADVDEVFACRCGAKSCRGSMLEAARKQRLPPRSPSARAAAKRNAARKSATKKSATKKRAAKRSSRRAH